MQLYNFRGKDEIKISVILGCCIYTQQSWQWLDRTNCYWDQWEESEAVFFLHLRGLFDSWGLKTFSFSPRTLLFLLRVWCICWSVTGVVKSRCGTAQLSHLKTVISALLQSNPSVVPLDFSPDARPRTYTYHFIFFCTIRYFGSQEGRWKMGRL